jgi:hypothetical protein
MSIVSFLSYSEGTMLTFDPVDFGLAIPLLSGSGQRDLVHQLMELCPTNKLLWSSDAAFHPERFYLGALQSRQALAEVSIGHFIYIPT